MNKCNQCNHLLLPKPRKTKSETRNVKTESNRDFGLAVGRRLRVGGSTDRSSSESDPSEVGRGQESSETDPSQTHLRIHRRNYCRRTVSGSGKWLKFRKRSTSYNRIRTLIQYKIFSKVFSKPLRKIAARTRKIRAI